MLVGGYLLIFTLVHNFLSKIENFLTGINVSEHGFNNIKMIGAIIYHAYVANIQQRCPIVPDNTAAVTLNIPPAPRSNPLIFGKN